VTSLLAAISLSSFVNSAFGFRCGSGRPGPVAPGAGDEVLEGGWVYVSRRSFFSARWASLRFRFAAIWALRNAISHLEENQHW
jgi:hypothetical protein